MRSKVLFSILSLVITFISFGQCAMCKANAESSVDDSSSIANGLNSGILILMSLPYLFFLIAFLYWRHMKKKGKSII